MPTGITSYGKVYALGHRAIRTIFSGTVTAEEKIDGSQFNFGVFGGRLECRSRGSLLSLKSPQKLFALAVETALRIQGGLHDGWVYRGEAVTSPRHNTLRYERIPIGGIILFDSDNETSDTLTRPQIEAEAHMLGLEVVPLLFEGTIENLDTLQELLKTESCLGGTKIEGAVVKSSSGLLTPDGYRMKGKYVSPEFQEKHTGRKGMPRQPIEDVLAQAYCTEARWAKAVQHLREADKLLGEPKDIGALVKAVQADVMEECKDEIKDRLWVACWRALSKDVVRGLPEWYKEQLAGIQFSDTSEPQIVGSPPTLHTQ